MTALGLQIAVTLLIANTPPLDAAAIYKAAAPSVVMVEVMTPSGVSQGSGVVVGDRQIATNAHVIKGAIGSVLIKQGDQTWRAEIENEEPSRDLAVLGVVLRRTEKFPLPSVKRRGFSTVVVGERVFAIGAPQGLESTLSDGLVSGVPSLVDTKLVQTTAAISPGSSGGGLFDAKGALVGITTLYLKDTQNINFAVSAEELAPLLAKAPLWAGKPYELGLPAPATGPTGPVAVEAASTAPPAAPEAKPILPLKITDVTAVVVRGYTSGPIATVGNMTSAWVKARLSRRLKERGIWVYEDYASANKDGRYAASISIDIGSLNIKDTVFYPWRISINVDDYSSFASGGGGPVTIWTDGTFGYGGSGVVIDQVTKAIDGFGDSIAAAMKHE